MTSFIRDCVTVTLTQRAAGADNDDDYDAKMKIITHHFSSCQLLLRHKIRFSFLLHATRSSHDKAICPSVRLSVCPCVCLSDKRVICDKTENSFAQMKGHLS